MYSVYLTIYTGNKLPMFYLGSTSNEKIKNGYRGSVKSKKFENIFKNELKQNPHLFKIKIISEHNTRKEAFEKEYKLQKQLKMASCPLYINEACASIYFCQRNSGKNHGFYGKKHTEETKQKLRKPKSEETKQKMRKPKSDEHRKKFLNCKNWQFRDYSLKEKCIHCGKLAMKTNITRWHNENCKLIKK